MPRKMAKRRKSVGSYKPIQVYVGPKTAGMWVEVQGRVEERQKVEPTYSLSQFVNEAVAKKLGEFNR